LPESDVFVGVTKMYSNCGIYLRNAILVMDKQASLYSQHIMMSSLHDD